MNRAVAFVILGLALPVTAAAQVDMRDKIAFTAAAFGNVSETSFIMVQGGITKFFTPEIEAGGDLSLMVAGSGDNTSTSTFLNARGRYNFVRQSLTVPFASLGLGVGLGDSSSQNFAVGGGAKRFLNEMVSLNGEANIQHQRFSSDFGSSSTTGLQFLFGISVYVR